MKKLDKKDLPKLVALVVLSLCLFGFALSQFVATPTTNAATKQAVPAAGGAAPGTPATALAKPEVSLVENAFRLSDITVMTSGKDPFVPNGPAAPRPLGAEGASRVVTTAPAPAPAPAAPEPELRNLMGLPSAPPSAGGPPNWAGPRGAEGELAPMGKAVAPVVPPIDTTPQYVVTGIVRGDTNVAILRGGPGGEERRFVRSGDSVGDGWKVAAVRSNGVEIYSGSRRITLRLGGDSRAK